MFKLAAALLLAAAILAPAAPALAADEVAVSITIKDHRFSPAEIKVPAGKAIILTVKNEDASAEEFESNGLKVEKVIPGKSTAQIRVKPLAAGRYDFVGEYNESTAKGVLIAE